MLINLDDRRIYFDLMGPENGPVVCFTHSLSSDSGMWAEQLPELLAAGYRILRLDMRGHGGSDPVDGDYTMAELAGDVRTSLDALAIRKVHFIGLSIGGMIGQAFAINHPDYVCIARCCVTRCRQRPMARKTPGAPVSKQSARPTPSPPWLTAPWNAGSRTPSSPRNPARWQQIHATIAGTTPAGYLGCGAAILNFDFRDDLPAIKAPDLVICGDDDQGTPPAGNKLIAEKIPGGRYEEIADARHFPNVEHPDMFNALMMPWLQSHR